MENLIAIGIFAGLLGWFLYLRSFAEWDRMREYANEQWLRAHDAEKREEDLRREVWSLRSSMGRKPTVAAVLMEAGEHLYEYRWELGNEDGIFRVVVSDWERQDSTLLREDALAICRAVDLIREQVWR